MNPLLRDFVMSFTKRQEKAIDSLRSYLGGRNTFSRDDIMNFVEDDFFKQRNVMKPWFLIDRIPRSERGTDKIYDFPFGGSMVSDVSNSEKLAYNGTVSISRNNTFSSLILFNII